MTRGSSLVEATGLGHRYGGSAWLFRHVSAKFERSTVTAVMGPSGSGKSTLLAILGRLTDPCEGQVRWHDPVARPAWIFQQTAGLPRRSCRDVVAAVTEGLGDSRAVAVRKSNTLLARVGLHHRSMALQRTLSGGEQQRLALACALAANRDVILMDEPTAQLDRATAGTVVDVLGATAQYEGAAVIVATHDPLVADAADAVVWIGGGNPH